MAFRKKMRSNRRPGLLTRLCARLVLVLVAIAGCRNSTRGRAGAKSTEDGSARITPDGESDGPADAKPVLDEFANLVNQRHIAMGNRRERQHHHMHEEIDQSAVNQTERDSAVN